MYAGMSGSTHGEIKLTNPAKNVSVKEIIITKVKAFCYHKIIKLSSLPNDLKKSLYILLSKIKKIFYFRNLKNCIKSINIFVFLKICI